MFKIGDYVVKKNCGILKICDIAELELFKGTGKEKYYVLKNAELTLTVNVPVKNAEKSIRSLMSKKEANQIENAIKSQKFDWITDEKQRKKYVEGLTLGTIEDALKLLGTYYERESENKKLALFEKTAVENSENKIYSEVAFVLGKTIDDVKTSARAGFGI